MQYIVTRVNKNVVCEQFVHSNKEDALNDAADLVMETCTHGDMFRAEVMKELRREGWIEYNHGFEQVYCQGESE